MEYDIERQDAIDRYVRGEMTNDEKKSFEAEMDREPVLKEEVLLDMSISDSICSMAEKKSRMFQWEREIAARKKKTMIWAVSTITSSAACIIAAFILLTPMQRHGQGMIALNGNHRTECTDTMKSILNLVEAGEYIQALSYINSYSGRNLPDSAVYDLAWLRIQTLIGLGRTEEALPELRDFLDKEGKYRREAEKLLEKFERQDK